MSSRAQRRANKRNAQHSTGPKTDQGKQTSSQNALKHGLRSQHPVIPGEDPEEYQRRLDELRADVHPVNALEDSLVTQIADTSWRLQRLSRIQAAIERDRIEGAVAQEKNAAKDDEQILGYAFTGLGRLDYLSQLARYESQLSRRYHRALKDLTDLQKSRLKLRCRVRAMDERDREEKQWRERHPQPPPIERKPPDRAYETTEQTQSEQTPLGAALSKHLDKLDPLEAVRRLDRVIAQTEALERKYGKEEAQETEK